MMLGLTAARGGSTRRMTDVTGAYDGGATGVMTGLSVDTKVASSMGWRKAGALTEGDRVLTFDAGLQPISKITRLHLWQGDGACPARFWPLLVPAGALGNRETMTLLPHQSVMIESDAAEAVYGDPFRLIPAVALLGVNGIRRVEPPTGLEVVILHFENDQVVFGNSGALLFCPAARDLLDQAFEMVAQPAYEVLPLNEARILAEELQGTTAAINEVSGCEGPVAA